MSEAMVAQRVTVRVPGKLNLALSVGPLREDGYHDLATVFQAVSVYDRVAVESAPEWSVRTVGAYAPQVPESTDNLALRAAQLLAERASTLVGTEASCGPVALTIEKNIPVAAGMAGGSADAAAALVGCSEVWDLGVLRDDLESLAAELGADVPFLLHGGTALGSGRGDKISPVLSRGDLHWVLWVTAEQGLSTPQVYAECDRLRGDAQVPAPVVSEDLVSGLRTMEPDAVGAALHNDLQAAALSLRPELQEVLDSGLDLGARGALVSGSGPTVAFLVGSQAEALDLSMGLAARGPAGDILRVTGPVAGAGVISSRGPGPHLGTG